MVYNGNMSNPLLSAGGSYVAYTTGSDVYFKAIGNPRHVDPFIIANGIPADLSFCPHNDSLIAVAANSDDYRTVHLYDVETQATLSFSSHTSTVRGLAWHPSATGIISSYASDRSRLGEKAVRV